MKKIFSVGFIIALMILASFIFFSRFNNDSITINVYNWGEFISDGSDGQIDVNKEFTKKTGIKVNYTTFQSNEALFAKLQSGATEYDVIIPSDYMVSKLIQKDMLSKIDFSQVPNFSYIDSSFKENIYDPDGAYSVPYVWGMVGIFYNKALVRETKEQIDWDIFWNEKYKNKILMFDNSRDAFAIAQLKLGLNVNSSDKKDWDLAANELKKQKPLVQSYVMDQIFDKMGNNEAALAPYYIGDEKALIKRNSNIDVVIPKSGTTKFVDAMCIPVNSNHKKEAMQYIDFMCEPTISKANAEKIGYMSPEKVVMDTTTQSTSAITKDIEKAQMFTFLNDSLTEYIDNLWVLIKVGQESGPLSLISVLVAFLLVYLFTVIKKRKKDNNISGLR